MLFKMKFGPAGMSGAYGTYASLVHSIANADDLRKFRKENRPPRLPKVGPSHKLKGIHWNKELKCYAVPFPGADVSIVRRSQQYLYEKFEECPLQYSMYMTVKSLFSLFLTFLFVSVLKIFGKTNWGTNILLEHPKLFSAGGFSKTGPTRKQIEQSSFSFHMLATGYKDEIKEFNSTRKQDKKITVKISGPEIGYATTPIAIVQAALTLIEEIDKLPESGGVFTTAAAFSQTTLIPRLHNRGITFKIQE